MAGLTHVTSGAQDPRAAGRGDAGHLDEVDASRAADANAGEDPGFARQVGRDFAEETGWLLIQAALFVVPCAIGLLVGGGLGLVVGFGVGIVLLGVFWVVVTVTGLKGLRQARREARQR